MVTRLELLKWADQHNYPALRFTGSKAVNLHRVQGLPDVTQTMKYAIGLDGCKENKVFWETAVSLGKEDMIEGLLMYINSLSAEQLATMKQKKPVTAYSSRMRGKR